MLIKVLKSKLHLATVTDACVDYERNMTISKDLLDQAKRFLRKILCGNMANGQRFETYIVPGEAGRGEIILNGPAHLGQRGDRLTIMTFTALPNQGMGWQPSWSLMKKTRSSHVEATRPALFAMASITLQEIARM